MPAVTKINLEPMPGKIIVKLDDSERMVNGIFLVSNARQSKGEVVAVYEEFTDPEDGVAVEPFIGLGDWIIFGQHSGVEVTVDRQKYLVIRESEVLCKILPKEEDPNGVL